jgi:hypothetical protein
MKGLFVVLALLVVLVGCDGSTESETATGRIRVEAFDTPPPGDLEALNLTITQVSVHDTATGWIVLAEPDSTYDFLQLINGVTATLADAEVPAGKYTQMRLVVADTNEIVVGGESYPLIVPSGTQTGVKLKLNFTVEEDQLVEIYVDFDASKAINWNPDPYHLHPTFKAFMKVLSVKVSGAVQDDVGDPIENALVEAVNSDDDTTSTLTDALGAYKLILLEGMYEISASAAGYTTADITYTDVEVDPMLATELTGYDFVLSP